MTPPPLTMKPSPASRPARSRSAVTKPRRRPGATVLAKEPIRMTPVPPLSLHSDGGAGSPNQRGRCRPRRSEHRRAGRVRAARPAARRAGTARSGWRRPGRDRASRSGGRLGAGRRQPAVPPPGRCRRRRRAPAPPRHRGGRGSAGRGDRSASRSAPRHPGLVSNDVTRSRACEAPDVTKMRSGSTGRPSVAPR